MISRTSCPSAKPRRTTLAVALAISLSSVSSLYGRELKELTHDWSFALANEKPDTSAVSAWQSVSLPHDWSINLPRSADNPSQGGGGFFQTGIGWYTKTFHAPKRWIGQKVYLEFEGVYQESSVSINGMALGEHAYGYTPFRLDISSYLNLGDENTIEVKVDNSDQPNSRWYTGSGIYRPVSLRVTDPIQILPEDVAVSTWYISEDGMLGTIHVKADARNLTNSVADLRIEATIIDPAGLPIASFSQSGSTRANESFSYDAKLGVPHPQVWSPDSPTLYRLVTRVFEGARLADRQETVFGIRTIEYKADEGFLLNEESIELIGANVHHDNGILGAAEYREAAFRKAALLKEAGFNAVRTAHNPPSSDFLDACDQLGLLVFDEAFDGWKAKKTTFDYGVKFEDNWEKDLTSLIRRDRNHPSVIAWSVGNEVYERGAESGIEIAANMAAIVHELDPTRPATAGINGLGQKKDWPKLDHLFANFDIVGYNYELHRHAADHERLPKRVIYSSESYLDDAFATWKTSVENKYVIGDFVWSGIDYLGEAGIGRVFPPDQEAFPHWEGDHYPWHGAYCGDIDLTGNRKPVSHYRNIVWDRGETLYAAILQPAPDGDSWNVSQWATRPLQESWTWPEIEESTELMVEVFSRHPEVELRLNGQNIGRAPTTEAEEFKAVFAVPYETGTLTAVGLDENGQETETFTVETAGPAKSIALTPDDSPLDESRRIHFIKATIVDDRGQHVPYAENAIAYEVEGPGKLIATGSANLASSQPYGANPRNAWQGKALIVVERTGPGAISISANADNLETVSIKLND